MAISAASLSVRRKTNHELINIKSQILEYEMKEHFIHVICLMRHIQLSFSA